MAEKKKKKNSIILWIVLVFFVGMTVFSGVKIYQIYREYKESIDEYSNIAHNVITTDPNPGNNGNTQPDPNGQQQGDDEPEETVQRVDFAQLKEMNKDCVGWITVPGTNINYPIVRGSNNEKYLHRSFTGKYNGAGTIFMDYRNSKDWSDRHTIIYGHLMKSKTMFYDVREFRLKDYFNSHRYIYIYTEDKTYVYLIYSFFQSETDRTVYRLTFADDADYAKYLKEVGDSSMYKTTNQPTYADHTITLSTCVEASGPKRWVLSGYLYQILDND